MLCWRALRTSKLIWFVPYLLFIVSVELIARFLYRELNQPNAWLYNLSIPVEYSFYTFIMYRFYTRKIFVNASYFFIAGLFLYSLINIIFITGLTNVNADIFVIGSIGCLFFSLISLFEIYRQDYELSVFLIPIFWITVGIMLFNAGEIMLNMMQSYLAKTELRNAPNIFAFINHNLINVLYSSFIIAFLCQKIYGTSKRVSAVT